jgi:hypothetical protein
LEGEADLGCHVIDKAIGDERFFGSVDFLFFFHVESSNTVGTNFRFYKLELGEGDL